MNSKLIALLFSVMGSAAFAAPILCEAQTSNYSIAVANDLSSATIKLNNEIPKFGELVCESITEESEDKVFLVCYSPDVADAGYQAIFSKTENPLNPAVQIDEFWFGGTKTRANLPCTQSQE